MQINCLSQKEFKGSALALPQNTQANKTQYVEVN